MPTVQRIVHVLLTLDPGGLERVVLDLVRLAPTLGQEAVIVCLERPGQLAAEVEAREGHVHCLYKPAGLRPGLVRPLARLLGALRPDIVHTHQVGALFYAGPAARLVGIPVVVHTEHGKTYAPPRRRWLGWLAALAADRFFCVTADIATELIARRIVPQRKVHVVANGIDTQHFATPVDGTALRQRWGIPAGSPIIGTIGRLVEVKRQDLLLSAFARLSERWPEAHLVLVGDGPLRDDLRQLAVQRGVAERVHFTGYQPHPEQFLHVMDVFALTSRSEGMPLVVLEAWAAGVPVVAASVGGLPEMIDERTGILFPPGDEGALAAALDGLLAERERARRLGGAGRAHVQAYYDLRQMAVSYQHHYQALRDRAKGKP